MKAEKAWTYNVHSGGIREEGDPDKNPLIAICYGDPNGSGANAAARICKCVNQHDTLVATLDECDTAFMVLNINSEQPMNPQARQAMRAAWEKTQAALAKALGRVDMFKEEKET